MLGNHHVSPELQHAVQLELEPGERIAWMDAPIPRFFPPKAIAPVLFAIPWTAFSVFWTVAVARGFSQAQSPPIWSASPLFGVPFILIGLGMFSAPLWAYRRSLRTVYAITDRRAIIITTGRATTIRSFRPDQLHNLYRTQRRNNIGDVLISRRTTRDSDDNPHTEELGFFNIRDPRTVEALVRKLATQHVADPPTP